MNGMYHPIKMSKVLGKLRREGVGLTLQETHLTEKEHDKLKKNRFNQVLYSSHKTGHKRGVAIFISGKSLFEKLSETKDKEGRYVLIKERLEGELFTVLNMNASPGSD